VCRSSSRTILRIGFDIDGTLCQHEEILKKRLEGVYGRSFINSNVYTETGLVDPLLKPTIERIYEEGLLLEVLEEVPFLLLENLAEKHYVYILTGRPEKIFQETMKIFHRKVPSLAGIIKTSKGRGFIVAGLKLHIVFEDYLPNIRHILNHSNAHIIMPDRHYNQNIKHKKVLRVKEVNEEICRFMNINARNVKKNAKDDRSLWMKSLLDAISAEKKSLKKIKSRADAVFVL